MHHLNKTASPITLEGSLRCKVHESDLPRRKPLAKFVVIKLAQRRIEQIGPYYTIAKFAFFGLFLAISAPITALQ
jgi:hypothetical protein